LDNAFYSNDSGFVVLQELNVAKEMIFEKAALFQLFFARFLFCALRICGEE
jgi:hypothetical protein